MGLEVHSGPETGQATNLHKEKNDLNGFKLLQK